METLYYGYMDNQRSLIAQTDQNGTLAEKYAYDPWGARRNPADWTAKDNRTLWITNRGYTGHEHLNMFNIINMNGHDKSQIENGMVILPNLVLKGGTFTINLGGNYAKYNLWERKRNTELVDKTLFYLGKANDLIDALVKTTTNGLTKSMILKAKNIAKTTIWIGVGVNILQVGNAFLKDGNPLGNNSNKAIAGAVGGWAGAKIGFEIGAASGAELGWQIGLYFEGVGAIPGTIIGTIGGGLIDSYGGAWGGNALVESF